MAAAGPAGSAWGAPVALQRCPAVLRPPWAQGQLPTQNLSTGPAHTHPCGLGPRATSPEPSVGFTRFGVDFEVFLLVILVCVHWEV